MQLCRVRAPHANHGVELAPASNDLDLLQRLPQNRVLMAKTEGELKQARRPRRPHLLAPQPLRTTDQLRRVLGRYRNSRSPPHRLYLRDRLHRLQQQSLTVDQQVRILRWLRRPNTRLPQRSRLHLQVSLPYLRACLHPQVFLRHPPARRLLWHPLCRFLRRSHHIRCPRRRKLSWRT